MKLARQFHAKAKENPQTSRTLFISRDRSYHGATLATLDLGGHKVRRALYEPMLANNTHRVSPCYPYRDQLAGETERDYVQRLLKSLEDNILELGPDNVAGFIVEPVVGAVGVLRSSLHGYDECHRTRIVLIDSLGTRERCSTRRLSRGSEDDLRPLRRTAHIR
jgi:adenosylmethionine-8-amino-7-oxononanoate aminotransferase